MRNEAAVLGLVLCTHLATAAAQDSLPAPVPIPPEESAAPADAPATAEPAAETAPAEAPPPAVESAPVEAPVAEAPVAEAAAEPVSAPVAESPAAETTGFHYLGVMGTFGFPDSGRNNNASDLENATGFSLLYGYQRADNWGIEVQGFSETLETSDTLGADWYRWGANVDLTYSFGDRTTFTPFVLAGVGGNMDDVTPREDKFTWFGNIGAGFVTGPLVNVGDLRVRGEVRGIYDDFQSGYFDVRLGLGVEIPLFGKRGVGVPEAPKEVVRIVEVNTGLQDSDGDGVIDERDQCPNTPAGTRVDGTGCPFSTINVLKGVNFEFDSDRLRPDVKSILDTLVETLKGQPGMNVEIAGHTDSVGAAAYNQTLSDKRAVAVRQYLVDKGVPAGQVTAKGYGENEPVADNKTVEGREINRRVEWRILN